MSSASRKCSAIKADGARCERIVAGQKEYCFSHDEARSEERAAIAAKGGRSRLGGDLSSIKKDLRQLADDVLEGKVNTAKGSVAAQIFGVLIRANQVELKAKEVEELERRIEQLEQRASAVSGGGRRVW